MKCKYVQINGFLIKDICDGKYTNMSFTRMGINKWLWKNGDKILGIGMTKKEIRFIKELCYHLSYVQDIEKIQIEFRDTYVDFEDKGLVKLK